jgi:ABC-2 type transport system ATP-binding protein
MSEMALTADHIIVLGRGRVLADAPVDELVRQWTRATVRIRTPRAVDLARLVARDGVTVTHLADGVMDVEGAAAQDIGDLALAHGIVLHELTPASGTLEDAYLGLTGDDVEYKTKDI